MSKRELTADDYRIAAEVVKEVWGDSARVDEIVLHRLAAWVEESGSKGVNDE